MTSTPVSPRRRLALGALGASAGLALALGAPLAASAHVHVDPGTAAAGGTQTLTFSFAHGCDGSPTTALAIDIPEGVGNATPIVQGGWTIQRETGADGVPTRVVFAADTPVDDGLKASVSLDVLFAEAAADSTLAFPVTQTCVTGETAWTQVADDGDDPDDLESPAPVVVVGAVDAGASGHGAGAAEDTDGAAAADGGAAVDGADPVDAVDEASLPAADPVARWLAAGGLAAGIAALVVVLVRGRRRA